MQRSEYEAGRMIELGNGLVEAVENVVNRAVPAFDVPPQLFANALLRSAIRTQLRTLGSRDAVKAWLDREAFAIAARLPRYHALGDEDENLMPSNWEH
jgi:hypothetical protein